MTERNAATSSTVADALESMIDRSTVSDILETIADIAYGKAGKV